MALNRRKRRVDQRGELLILLPVALLLLVLLSTFTLFSYRNTVGLLVEERRSEAVRLARRLAGTLPREPLPDAEELRRRLPGPRAVSIIDDDGRLLVATDTRVIRWAGDPAAGEDLVTGTARSQRNGRGITVQVDLAAPILRSRERGLRVLTPVLLTMNAAITLLVLVLLRHFWAPFEGLLERARKAGQEVPESGDEVDFLVATFEKALEALTSRDAASQSADSRIADSLAQLGELTAGVAHELRNSLATLRGYLTLIEREADADSVADYLGEIRRESDHLERVLEDFLSFARPGSVRPRQVDLLRLAHRAAADPALGGAAVTVGGWRPEAGGRDRGPRVEGDPQLLERALRNLVYNAVEAQRRLDPSVKRGAGPDPEPVRLSLRGRDQGVEIRIDDRGPGLSPEAQEKLFAPFFSQSPGGVGMGLALTRRIVLLHGGRVTLENRSGGGARATMWIPSGKVDTIGNGNRSPEESAVST